MQSHDDVLRYIVNNAYGFCAGEFYIYLVYPLDDIADITEGRDKEPLQIT